MISSQKKKAIEKWHPQQEMLLRDWAEIASGYRWLHDQAYRKFKKHSLGFTIPVIIMSTVTGTANFAQESFPVSWQVYVPMVIGMINLIAAIITTISQFLKVNELMEGNRVSSVSFGKLNRNITVELNLPHEERSSVGSDFLRTCQSEFDRLIEQSPPIPKDIAQSYKKLFGGESFAKPELLFIKKVNVFQDKESRKSIVLANAANAFKAMNKGNGKTVPAFSGITNNDIETPPPEKPEWLKLLKKPTLEPVNEIDIPIKEIVPEGPTGSTQPEPEEPEDPEEPEEKPEIKRSMSVKDIANKFNEKES